MERSVNTPPARERKAAPHISMTAFIQPSTVVTVSPIGEMVGVSFDGDDFGGVTLFFHDGAAFAAFVDTLAKARGEG